MNTPVIIGNKIITRQNIKPTELKCYEVTIPHSKNYTYVCQNDDKYLAIKKLYEEK